MRSKKLWLLLVVCIVQISMLGSSARAEVCDEPELLHDVLNCGTCGNACAAGSFHANWTCHLGSCEFAGCEAGFYDLDGDDSCEYACTLGSSTELCNGLDDDCDGLIDEDPTPPPADVACNVPLGVTAPECTTGLSITCSGAAWQCNFPANVCVGGCSPDDEICDGLDNDCDGSLNENVANFGQACRSDAGLAPPGHGQCATTGVHECDGPNATVCSASAADCATLPGGCTEACDGIDNDCDGSVDETFETPGTDPLHYVRPEVTRYAANGWMFTYEASRPDATATQPGRGNGYRCSGSCGSLPAAPAGVMLDGTLACSAPGRRPWSSVTPTEVEQICDALGGFVCDTSAYVAACESTASCDWGYGPVGAACTSPADASHYCNLSASFDFDPGTAGDQYGQLEGGSAALLNCGSDWDGTYPGNDQLFDLTGNIREITKAGTQLYPVMGGSYLTEVETGATCDFDFLIGDAGYSSPDAGFRCCFDVDPSQ